MYEFVYSRLYSLFADAKTHDIHYSNYRRGALSGTHPPPGTICGYVGDFWGRGWRWRFLPSPPRIRKNYLLGHHRTRHNPRGTCTIPAFFLSPSWSPGPARHTMPLLSLTKKIFLSFSNTERRMFFAAAGVFAISFLSLTVLLIQKSTEVVPTEGGRYTEGIVGQPTYVNPVLAASNVDKSLVRLLFASLTDLSEKINVDETGRLVRVRLKENLFWSDGTKLTSDDVIFTIEKIQDPETNSPLFSSWQGVVASRSSQLEIFFHLASPYVFFLDNLNNLYILPKHLYAEVPAANWRLSDYNLRPVGSGPYVFVSYENRPNGFVTAYHLQENMYYAGEKPLIKNFDFRLFSKNEDLLQSFNTGQVDGFASLEPSLIDDIQRPYEIIPLPSPTIYAVFWNQSQNLALQSPEVREALSISLNREEIVARALGDYTKPAISPIPDTIPGPLPLPQTPTSTFEAAVALLEEHGWELNEEEIREKSIRNGHITLSFDLTTPDIPFLVTTARALVEQWGTLGADINIIIIPPGRELDSAIRNRDYQAILFGNSVRESGDLFSFWHSSERFYPGLNLALYNNSEADGLIEAVRQNFNPEERYAQLQELQQLIVDDFPAAFLYSPQYIYITDKNVQGIAPRFLQDISDRFLGVNRWYLKTARVLK